MASLENQRWELMAQSLAKGETATKAYELAGFRPSRSNAARLSANENVRRRVQEIMAAGAASAEVTIGSLLGELEAARAKATSLDQLSAAVRAIEAKGKISGVTIERREVSVRQEMTAEQRREHLKDILRRIGEEHGIEDAMTVAKCFGVPDADAGNGKPKQIEHRGDEWKPPVKAKREI